MMLPRRRKVRGRSTRFPRALRAVPGAYLRLSDTLGLMPGEERRERRATLASAGLILASELELPVVLQRIVDLARDVAGARYAALGIVGRDGRIEEFLTSGMSDEQRRAIGGLPEGKGILGLLIEDARPLRLERLQDHPRSVGFPPNHPPMRSFLGVPIAIRGQVFGHLYLTEKEGGTTFSESDEAAIVELAAHAGLAVEIGRLYHSSQTSQRRFQAVNEIAQATLQGRGSDDLLRLIARSARELVDARLATIIVPQEGAMEIIVADGVGAEELRGLRLPLPGSLANEVMKSGSPVVVGDSGSDPRVDPRVVAPARMGPLLTVRLASAETTFGTLTVSNHVGDRRFSEEDVAVMEAFASQAAVTLEHGRIRMELNRLAVSADRERIAKDLHDDVIQSLFAEGMALEASLASVSDPVAMQARITQTVDHLDAVIRDLRNYIFGLRPASVAHTQIERSLRDLVHRFAEGTQIRIEVAVEPDVDVSLAGHARDMMHMAREAISNAIRHSAASRIDVSLIRAGSDVMLEVADDGRGFSPDDVAGDGLGLANLRSRATSLGGELEIESEEGVGTWVRVRLPG